MGVMCSHVAYAHAKNESELHRYRAQASTPNEHQRSYQQYFSSR